MIDQISPQILIVDDHPSVRSGVRRAVECAGMRCCGEAASRDEAFAQITLHVPDGVVLDLNLPDGSGLDVISWIREHSQTMAIVMLTMSDEDSHLLAAMKSGASAYVEKSAPLAELISAIEHSAVSPLSFSAQGISGVISKDLQTDSLTIRETQVLQKLADGFSAGDIGLQLFITQATVKTHLASIYRKLESKNRIQAIIAARKKGLLLS